MQQNEGNLKNDLMQLSDKCMNHARKCRNCYIPIMDEEGNPQFVGEACEIGAKLLTKYCAVESEYFKRKF